MRESYSHIKWRYQKITLSEERRLILKAQKGSKKSREELILRHVGFVIFRIHKVAFPALIQRFGEDLLEEAILILYKKIKSYDLNYRIDTLKKELNESNYYDRYSGYAFRNGDLSSLSGPTEADNFIS